MPRSAGRMQAQLGDKRCRAALLLIDVINRFDFEGGEALLRNVRPVADRIATLCARAREVDMPVVYANDNFGLWRSDFRNLVRTCKSPKSAGRDIALKLAPAQTDYFVLKPANSAFYGTVLELLLRHCGVDTLILTGLQTDNCVLFTAHDAYLRGFRLLVPRDCVASEKAIRSTRALEIVGRSMKADTRASHRINLEELLKA